MAAKQIQQTRHWQTQRLVDFFSKMVVGTPADYATVAQACSMPEADVRDKAYRAKGMALRDHCVLIETIPGEGFERIAQDDFDVPASRHKKRMLRSANGIVKTIRYGITNLGALSPDKQNAAGVLSAQGRMVQFLGRKDTTKKLSAAAATTNHSLDVGRTLEALKK